MSTRSSIQAIESLIPRYPTHFLDIEAVKSYIASVCAFSLADPANNKLAFLVAVRAFEGGEFYLDKGLLDRGALRDAITKGVERLMLGIKEWPRFFAHVGAVKNFVANRCPEINGMVFEGVENSTFQGYILFHTARVAWEARKFDMGVVPKAWKRRAVEVQVKVPQTLRETVDLNIAHLTPLLPPWSRTFSDLNAARDHVRQCCYAMHFRYTYFPGEEQVRFRTIVQFNTAKYAHRRGDFVLDAQRERVGVTRGAGSVGVKRDSVVEKENGGGGAEKVSTAPYSLKRDGKVVSETWEDFRKRAALAVRAGGEVTPPLSASDGGETMVGGAEVVKTEEGGDEENKEKAEVNTEGNAGEKVGVKTEEKPAEAIDPFKALIADLRRVSVLKAAFE